MPFEQPVGRPTANQSENQDRQRARNMLQIMLASRWGAADLALSADERLTAWIERYGKAFGDLIEQGEIPAVSLLKNGFPAEGVQKVERLLEQKISH